MARFLAGLVALSVSGAVMAFMVWRALLGLITLGDLVLIYQAFIRGQGLMRSLLSSVGQIYSNSLFLGSFLEFLRLRSSLSEVDQSRPNGACARPYKLTGASAGRQTRYRPLRVSGIS